jgi:hypothetical protein
MIAQQRYLARYVGQDGNDPVFALGCFDPTISGPSVPRVLARFLGLVNGVPLYGYSTCEFPRIGRYLMRFVGMTPDSVPVYAISCCPEGSSGSSGLSGSFGKSSGYSGFSGSSGLSGEGSGYSGSSGASSGLSGSSGESSGFSESSGLLVSSGISSGVSGSSGESSGYSGSSGMSSGVSGTSGESSGFSGSSGSSGFSGESGSASGSGSGAEEDDWNTCPDEDWEFFDEGGAWWSGSGWSIRINYEDSTECGGTNFNTQGGSAIRRVCLSRPRRLIVTMTGMVETHRAGYELAYVYVNNLLVAWGQSYEENGGCTMREATASGFIDLPAGEHLIELWSSTGDELYHVGAYWQFDFSWEPL